ncbi:MAG: hypothetical protein JW822_12535 [Spirochaetales bacterium]|nr:hypothetical protein [Spirochaetales bacterium]
MMFINRAKIVFVLVSMLLIMGSISYTEDDIDDLLSSGLADKRQTEQGLNELLNELKGMLQTDSGDYDALWMYAALNYFYGDFYATEHNTKKRYFTICKDYADKAVRIKRTGVAAHYWLGVGMAKWAEYNGIIYSLFSADDILKEMTIVITLNPNFFKGMPWAIRATVYALAPGGISVGDRDKARTDITKALFYGYDYRQTYQLIADIYIAWGEWENAKKMIDVALTFPFNSLMEVEERDCIRKLNEQRQKVAKELAKR